MKILRKYFLRVALLLILERQVSSQKWLNQEKRSVYATDGSELTLEWQLEKQGKNIFFASWKLIDEKNEPQQTLLNVDAEGSIIVQNASIIECKKFGVLKFYRLDQRIFKRVIVTIDFDGVSAPFTDVVYIIYVAPLKLTQSLPKNVTFIENSISTKNVTFIVEGEGNPMPSLYWKLNGKNMTSYEGFVLSSEVLPLDEILTPIINVLFINQIKVEHIGKLEVVLKYGDEKQQSPQLINEVIIEVLYPPKNVVLSSNLTTFFVLLNYYVNLTCTAKGNPPPQFTITRSDTILQQSFNNSIVTYLDPYEESVASFLCVAKNFLGKNESNVMSIRVFNGSDYIRGNVDPKANEWWIYYLVIVAVSLVIFIGTVATVFVVRRKMRSMNVKQQTARLRFRSADNQNDNERAAMRHSRVNRVYHLNQRGAPDGQRDANVYSSAPTIKSANKTSEMNSKISISTLVKDNNLNGVLRRNDVPPLPLEDLTNHNLTDQLSNRSSKLGYQNNGYHY